MQIVFPIYDTEGLKHILSPRSPDTPTWSGMIEKEERKRQQHREANVRYRERHKERLSKEKADWLKANPEKRKATTARYRNKVKPLQEQHRRENFEWYMWNSIRTRSKRLGYDFNLELEDIVIPEVCPYLLQPLTRLVGQGRGDWNPSVDRIDTSKGYVKGNIEIVSDKANRMKNNATKEELIQFAKSVLEKWA
jgi:hypothetical protein